MNLRPTKTAKDLSKLYDLAIHEIDAVVKGVIKAKPTLSNAELELMVMRNLDMIIVKEK